MLRERKFLMVQLLKATEDRKRSLRYVNYS